MSRPLLIIAVLLLHFTCGAQDIITKFEQSKGTQTPTYAEIVSWWQHLDESSGKVKMLTMGMSDAGFPLHLVLVSNNGDYNLANIHQHDKRIILINNGIHPGEPDGIDASMLLVRDIAAGKYKIPDGIILAFIPVYNIGGCLNRSADYRVDQNGPEEFGFRGNSENLDLNRDFIKCDSREARSFVSIFHALDPDVFVDNHVSDGADYQHVVTLLASQHDKLGGVMGEFMNKQFEPGIYASMKEKGYDLIPYVNAFGDTPENGWPEFWDGPRFGSGYGSLWNTFSFVPETHMLKPYDQRVKATYQLMQCFIEFTVRNSALIKKTRDEAKKAVRSATSFPLNWSLDKTRQGEILFKGYASGHKPSEISGLPRLYYDRSKPFEKKIPFFNHYTAQENVKAPTAYIIPQGWWKVIELLQLNKVKMTALKRDTAIDVEVYRISDYKASPRPYEMHHINTGVKTESKMEKRKFRKGDWLIPMNQEANRFIFEVLEPKAEDSYFTWNFFDGVLGQKEGYSAYAFEDIAAEYLKNNPGLQTKLDQRRRSDTAFARNGSAQLNFIYQNSPWIEPVFMEYPVCRVAGGMGN
ncbi:MAG TPA: M14 family metallopeptidase [Chitinophagaceae bacterium]|nr:M14 family metallopeptidase [Chitinophagaceae bacterium]